MHLPSSLQPVAERAMQSAQQAGYIEHWSAEFAEQYRYVAGLSPFIVEALQRDSLLAEQLPTMLADESRQESYRAQLAALLAECRDEATGQRVLRQFRNREMVYIAWKDFSQSWSLQASLSHLSQLAEAMIFETYQWQYALCCQEWGTPTNAAGKRSRC